MPDFHPFNQKEPEFSARYDWQSNTAETPPKQQHDIQSYEGSRQERDDRTADLFDLGAFSPHADDWADSIRLEYDSFWDRVMEDDERVWVVAFIDPEDPAC